MSTSRSSGKKPTDPARIYLLSLEGAGEMQNKFAIVILNWNGLKDTIECIQSILNNQYSNIEIFCLDNGSKKREDIHIKKIKSNRLNVVRIDRNLGFAGGNNYICSRLSLNKYDYIFLLNNDTVIKQDFFKKINEAINVNENEFIGIYIPTIFYYDKELNEKKIWQADDSKIISKHSKIIKYPTGCAVIIKSEVIQKNGLFDEDFFAYGEEVEYFYRISKKGIKILYVPEAVLWHKVVEAEDNLFKIYMTSRNKWYYWKKRTLPDKFLYLIYILFFYNINKLIRYSKRIKNLQTFIRGNIDGILWIVTNKKPLNPYIDNQLI